MKNKSEFGKGLVINLVKFTEHFSNDTIMRINNIRFYQSKSEKEKELIMAENPLPKYDYGKKLRDDIKIFFSCEYQVYGNWREAISSMIGLWANGATDHLYEIKTPEDKGWDKIRLLVEKLQSKGLAMGHGFTNKIYEYKDVLELQKLIKKISILIDEKLGLEADWGEW